MSLGLNYERLKDPKNEKYNKEIHKAPKILVSQDAEKFFDIVLPNFRVIDDETGNKILLELCKILQNKKFVKPFVQGNYIQYLPFDKPRQHEQLLDLLALLIRHNCNTLNRNNIQLFEDLTKNNPSKCLTLLAILATRYEKIRDPDVIFQNIIDNPEMFINDSDVFYNYTNLIIYLVREFDSFCKQCAKDYSKKDARKRSKRNIKKCWQGFCSLLSNSDVEIIKICFYGLCSIFDLYPKIADEKGFPVEACAQALKNPSTCRPALALLIRYPPRRYSDELRLLVKELLRTARTNKNATLILMDMAAVEDTASILIDNPKWMADALPDVTHTMRLFAVVLTHVNLRNKLIGVSEESEEEDYQYDEENQKERAALIVKLFQNLIGLRNPSICSILTSFVRRLPLTPILVAALSKEGIISQYIELFAESDELDVCISAMLFISTLAKVRYSSSYLMMIEHLMPLLKREDTSEVAISLCLQLSKYQKTASAFHDAKIDLFFKRISKNGLYKKKANRFLDNIQCG